jgi:hypothetical protein
VSALKGPVMGASKGASSTGKAWVILIGGFIRVLLCDSPWLVRWICKIAGHRNQAARRVCLSDIARSPTRIFDTAGVSGCIQSPSVISAIRGLFAPYPAPEMSHQPDILTLGHRLFETFLLPTTMEEAVPHLGFQLLATCFSAHPSNAPLF